MSWGERTCERERPCGFNPTFETCNKKCQGYLTTPKKPLTKNQLKRKRKKK